jgi:hypothetical protein
MYTDITGSCVEDKISGAALSVLDALNSTGGDIIGECVHDAVQTVIPQECSDAVCDFIEMYIDNCVFDDMEGDEA